MVRRHRSPTGLYWSAEGEVACARHAPKPPDPRWTTEDWAPVSVLSGEVQGATAVLRHTPQEGVNQSPQPSLRVYSVVKDYGFYRVGHRL
jgi:hypothetical protein